MPKATHTKKKKKKKVEKKSLPANLHPALLNPEELLVRFLQRVLSWLKENHARIIDIFQKLDSDGDNLLSMEDFVIGLRMLDAPASKPEIEKLLGILDTDKNGIVDILEFDKIIRDYHRLLILQKYNSVSSDLDTEDSDMMVSAVSLTLSPSRVSTKCPNCEIGLAEPPQERAVRFLQLQLTLAPFQEMPKHPAHTSFAVMDSITIAGICLLIKAHLRGATTTIAIFTDSSCSRDSYLLPSLRLAHCMPQSGPRETPTFTTKVKLFYDYRPEFIYCPILMNDTYYNITRDP